MIREPLAEQCQERGIERDLVGDLGLFEQALRGERVLDEDPVAKTVDREDGCVIERGDRIAQPFARGSVELPPGLAISRAIFGRSRQAIQQVANPQPQLRDRFVGERDEQDLGKLRTAEHEIDDAMLEEERLSRSRRRLDDDEPIGGRRQRSWTRDASHRSVHSSPAPRLISPCMRAASGPSRALAIAVMSAGSSSPYGLSIGPKPRPPVGSRITV